MALIDPHHYSLSFSLLAKNWTKMSRAFSALPSFRPRVGAPVALQQCRILRTSTISLAQFFLPFSIGDISTLQNKGHFYFALTLLTNLCSREPTNFMVMQSQKLQ